MNGQECAWSTEIIDIPSHRVYRRKEGTWSLEETPYGVRPIQRNGHGPFCVPLMGPVR